MRWTSRAHWLWSGNPRKSDGPPSGAATHCVDLLKWNGAAEVLWRTIFLHGQRRADATSPSAWRVSAIRGGRAGNCLIRNSVTSGEVARRGGVPKIAAISAGPGSEYRGWGESCLRRIRDVFSESARSCAKTSRGLIWRRPFFLFGCCFCLFLFWVIVWGIGGLLCGGWGGVGVGLGGGVVCWGVGGVVGICLGVCGVGVW